LIIDLTHVSFLKKLNTLPEMETQVKAWLKAGIMEEFSKQNNGKIFRENQKELHRWHLSRYYLILLSMEWKNI
jgi:hypothetical protein